MESHKLVNCANKGSPHGGPFLFLAPNTPVPARALSADALMHKLRDGSSGGINSQTESGDPPGGPVEIVMNEQAAEAPNRGNAGKGRKKGVPNKATKAIKEMILQALDEAHPDGGVEYLKRQANEQPVAFMGLLAKVLPMQLTGEDGGAIQVTAIRWVD